jgi:hypothetical protein
MRKHIAIVCKEGHLKKIKGIVVVEDGGSGNNGSGSGGGARTKPGPKPFDLSVLLKGRFPACSDHGDDERIDHVFSSGLIGDLLRAECEDIPALLYHALWSTHAPEHLQSFIMYRNVVYEIETMDEDTGAVTYTSRGSLTRRFIKEIAVYTLELAFAIAKDSVPSRTPDLIPEAHKLFERLCCVTDGMTLRDAIISTERYTKKSFALRHKLDVTMSRLNDGMQSSFPTCFSSCN